MFWLGLGIAFAGFFIGSGIQEFGAQINEGLQQMWVQVKVFVEKEEDEEDKTPNETCA